MDTSAFTYDRDDARRRIRVTAQRLLNASDLIAIVDQQLEEQAWSYGTLYDLRLVNAATSRPDAVAVAAHVEALVAKHGPRGPVALVTRFIKMVGAGQLYAIDSSRKGRSVDVFWDLDEAEAWLTKLQI
jgi:hypothetical protein